LDRAAAIDERDRQIARATLAAANRQSGQPLRPLDLLQCVRTAPTASGGHERGTA